MGEFGKGNDGLGKWELGRAAWEGGLGRVDSGRVDSGRMDSGKGTGEEPGKETGKESEKGDVEMD